MPYRSDPPCLAIRLPYLTHRLAWLSLDLSMSCQRQRDPACLANHLPRRLAYPPPRLVPVQARPGSSHCDIPGQSLSRVAPCTRRRVRLTPRQHKA